MMRDANNNQVYSHTDNDEIDLKQVFATLSRHKRLVGGMTLAAIIFSTVYAYTKKPLWEGSFQIVLENNEGNANGRLAQLAASNPMLSSLAGLGGVDKSSLRTEVKVLESPSVLKPIYDYVKAEKAEMGNNSRNWSYKKWLKKSISIQLLKGTSVLNLAYRDTDEELVLPVLNRISKTYQTYSGRDRKRGLSQAVTYLEDQIDNLQLQSERSMRAAQNYALINGLAIQDGLPTFASGVGSELMSVEGSREIARNKVNAFRQQIDAARSVGDARLYQAPQLEANTDLYSKLQELESELNEKSALLTPGDQTIQALNRQRKSLIAYINQQTIGLLQGKLMTAEAELASLTRPRDVVLKHRELVRTAVRDEKLLTEIESQLQAMRLDQARQTDPWELISNPTLLDKPVAPRKGRIVALGSFIGFLSGCITALIHDRRRGLVFSEEELRSLMPCPMLDRLPVSNPENWISTGKLLMKGPFSEVESIGLIPVGTIPDDQLERLHKALATTLGDKTLMVSPDLLATRACDTQLLVTAPGAVQRQQLQKLQEQLALQGTPLAGWLLLDPKMEA